MNSRASRRRGPGRSRRSLGRGTRPRRSPGWRARAASSATRSSVSVSSDDARGRRPTRPSSARARSAHVTVPSSSNVPRASRSRSAARRFSFRRRWTWPSARSVRARSNGIGSRSCSPSARSRLQRRRRGRPPPPAGGHGRDVRSQGPWAGRDLVDVLEELHVHARPIEVPDGRAASIRSPSSLNRPGWRVPIARPPRRAPAVHPPRGPRRRERDEAEDVAVVDLERQVAAAMREVETLCGEAPCIVVPALVRRDEGEAAEPPGREDVGPFPCVALDGRRAGAGARHVAAKELEPGELDEVEGIVAARSGLGADEVMGHGDRPIQVVHARASPNAIPSAPSCSHDRPVLVMRLPPRDLLLRDALDEPERGDRVEQQHVREEVRICAPGSRGQRLATRPRSRGRSRAADRAA